MVVPRRTPSPLPGWAAGIAEPGSRFDAEANVLGAAVELAVESARHGGGPFGAVITDAELGVIDVGWNHVVEARDSTAHAEVHAIRRTQGRLDTHDLGSSDEGPLTLFGSCAPCIQCFGVIYWSGLDRVVTAAPMEAAQAVGFDEGPVSEDLWTAARERKGILFEREASSGEPAEEPFRVYKELGGLIY